MLESERSLRSLFSIAHFSPPEYDLAQEFEDIFRACPALTPQSIGLRYHPAAQPFRNAIRRIASGQSGELCCEITDLAQVGEVVSMFLLRPVP